MRYLYHILLFIFAFMQFYCMANDVEEVCDTACYRYLQNSYRNHLNFAAKSAFYLPQINSLSAATKHQANNHGLFYEPKNIVSNGIEARGIRQSEKGALAGSIAYRELVNYNQKYNSIIMDREFYPFLIGFDKENNFRKRGFEMSGEASSNLNSWCSVGVSSTVLLSDGYSGVNSRSYNRSLNFKMLPSLFVRQNKYAYGIAMGYHRFTEQIDISNTNQYEFSIIKSLGFGVNTMLKTVDFQRRYVGNGLFGEFSFRCKGADLENIITATTSYDKNLIYDGLSLILIGGELQKSAFKIANKTQWNTKNSLESLEFSFATPLTQAFEHIQEKRTSQDGSAGVEVQTKAIVLKHKELVYKFLSSYRKDFFENKNSKKYGFGGGLLIEDRRVSHFPVSRYGASSIVNATGMASADYRFRKNCIDIKPAIALLYRTNLSNQIDVVDRADLTKQIALDDHFWLSSNLFTTNFDLQFGYSPKNGKVKRYVLNNKVNIVKRMGYSRINSVISSQLFLYF